MTPALQINQLTRRFGSFTAVDKIQLQVNPGEAFGFLGPNGSGKTTTVRLLTGLLAYDEGDILYEGKSLEADPMHMRRITGVVSGKESLFRRVTLWEHLIMVGKIHGLDKETIVQRAEDLLRFGDLWEKRGTYANEASHGMQKKLLLGMALIHKPRILILDEPFEGLDPLSVRKLSELIARLIKSGVTMFITSHLLHEVERLVDHFVIINEGRIVYESSISELNESGQSLEDLYYSYLEKDDRQALELPWLV